MAQFALPGKYEKSRGVSSTFASVSLPYAFVEQTAEKTSEWIGNSGTSSHTTNDGRNQNVRYSPPPFLDKTEITPNDGTRRDVEQIRNIVVIFHGRNDEPIITCDVSYLSGFIRLRRPKSLFLLQLDHTS